MYPHSVRLLTLFTVVRNHQFKSLRALLTALFRLTDAWDVVNGE